MPREMKDWGGHIMYDGDQRKAIVRTDTKKMAAELFDVSMNCMNDYFSVTGNKTEKAALDIAGPNVVLVEVERDRKVFKKLPYSFRNVLPRKIPKLSDLTLCNEYHIACIMRDNGEFYHDWYQQYIEQLEAEIEKRGIEWTTTSNLK